MGLDITVYPRTIRLAEHTCSPDDDECWERHVQAYAYQGFEQSLRGCEPLTERTLDSGTVFVEGGWYEVNRDASWGFRAGSYSGYNGFRRALATAAWGVDFGSEIPDADDYRDREFFELIYFADNEGTIGPEAAVDLAADFINHGERVAPQLEGWHVDSYKEWTRAFKDAAGTGLVEFH